MTVERKYGGSDARIIDIKPHLSKVETPEEFITKLSESVTTTLENDIIALTELQGSEFITQPEIKSQPGDSENRIGKLHKLTTYAADSVYP